jgi:hypothetical protein
MKRKDKLEIVLKGHNNEKTGKENVPGGLLTLINVNPLAPGSTCPLSCSIVFPKTLKNPNDH